MLLQHLGAIRRFVLLMVPAASGRLRKASEPEPASTLRPVQLASVDALARTDEAEAVDARIAKIINDIPQRRIRRHA